VSEELLDDLGIPAPAEKERGARVTEVVEAGFLRNAALLRSRRKGPPVSDQARMGWPVWPGKMRARSREALLESIGAAIWALSAEDARGYLDHCGYRTSVQSLW
jgi:hypothetical protein